MAYLDDIRRVWHMIREDFRQELGEAITDLWFNSLDVTAFESTTLTMTTDSDIKRNVLINKYKKIIENHFADMLGFEITVDFVSHPVENDLQFSFLPGLRYHDSAQQSMRESPTSSSSSSQSLGSTLPPFNFEYTFENFIVGSSNKFAHAACLAIADRPAHVYNPLFIYGPSGLGKTHLLYAITNELKRKNPDIKVIYIKGEDFTNQMIDSLSRQAMKEFRDKYRSCDVLLIDDIQFIAGKTATQEEFFHTFNTLHEDGRQIILTSDRPPRDIKTLEERLRTRFEWGLIADIQPPDLELRIAIIKKKAESVNVSIPDEVLTYLAENLRSNIRQIEGAIKKLGAMCFLSGQQITMEVARNCITDLLGGAEPVTVTVEKVFSSVYKKYNIPREDIVSTKRTKDITAARHIAVYLIRHVTEMSLPNIGKIFGRDHSTIISSIDKVENQMTQSVIFRSEIDELIKEINGS